MRVRITMFATMCAIVGLFLVAMAGYAQQTLGTISGTITDSSGAVLPGAKVELVNSETGISRSVVTNSVGFYNAPALGLGNYKVTATQDGFQTEVRSGIELTIGRNAVVNFQLKVGSVATTVEVTGEAPLVETTKGGLGSLVESKTVTDLPLNGRDLAQLITLQTGAVEYTAAGAADLGSGKLLVVSGARPTTNVFLFDGISVESFTEKAPTGASGIMLGAEGVREFRVESNAYSAEYGRGAGGIFNVASKSGTNQLHGSLFEYIRNDNFDANKWENNHPPISAPKPEFKRNQFGGSLGGPIKKDRTFYFGTYEALRERLGLAQSSRTFSDPLRAGIIPGSAPMTINSSVVPYLQSELWPKPNSPCQTQCLAGGDPFEHQDGSADFKFAFSQPTNEHYVKVRLDHKLNDKDSFFGSYNFQKSTQLKTGAFPYEHTQDLVKSHTISIQNDWIISPTLLNTTRAGFSRNLPVEQEVQSPPIPSSLYFQPAVPQMGGLSPTVVSGVGQGVPGEQRGVNSFQEANDTTLTKGRHTMKFGLSINRIQFNGYNPARDALQYAFNSLQDFFNANPNGRFRGTVFGGFNDAHRSFRDTIFGFYYQDDIHVTSRLTLNAGLRYEFITTPSEVYGRIGTFRGDINFIRSVGISGITTGNPWINNPSLKNFAPRVGFAWDVAGNGKTALRGGAGIFFQQFDQSWYRTSAFRTPPFLVEADIAARSGANTPAVLPFPNIVALCGAKNPFAIPSTDPCAGAKSVPDVVFYNISNPYVAQYNLNIQRQLMANTVLTVGYAGSRGIDLAGIADFNNWDPVNVGGRLAYSAALVSAGIRPNPNWDQIRERHTGYDSWYNSLQVNVNRKYSRGLLLNGSYTWSKNEDTISGIQTASDTAAGPSTIPLYGQASLYKGRSAFDARHVFSFQSTYELPFGPGKQFMNAGSKIAQSVVEGWQVGGIVTLASGFPGTIGISTRMAAIGVNAEAPDLAPGASNNPTSGTSIGCSLPLTATTSLTIPAGTPLGQEGARGPLGLYYDPCAFVVPPDITVDGVTYRVLGNVGRNTIDMAGRATVDFNLSRDFKLPLSEASKIQFRFEAFNLFNRVNFGIPSLTQYNASGRVSSGVASIGSTIGTPRQLQFALKMTF